MDGRQFDGLARSLGRSRSRRSAIWVLLSTTAVVLGGKRASAQQGWVPIGGACYNTGQCIQDGDYISVFCDNNGFAYDGDTNCCRYQGYCQADEECCGTSFCYQGQCTTEADDSGSAGPDPGQGLPLGAQCSYAGQCEGGGYYVDCASNGGFVPACCLISGQGCSTDLDCCLPGSCVYQAAYRYAICI
jgi:hypothetical protein